MLTAGPPAVVVATGRCPKCGGRVLAGPDDAPGDWPRLPTRDEYRTAERSYQNRAALLIGAGVVGGLVGCLGGVAGVMDLVTLTHSMRVAFTVLGMLGPPVLAIFLLGLMARRARWDESLACGWCGEVLAGQAGTVLTSGRCIFCGRPALDDPAPGPSPDATGPYPTRDEVVARDLDRFRTLLLGTGVGLAVIAAGLATAFAPLAVFGGWAEYELWLTPQVGKELAIEATEHGPVVIICLTAVVGLLIAAYWDWRGRRRNPLDCPSCGKSFDPGLAIAAGRCNQCFRPVVSEESPPNAGSHG
jgi:ribosomal protein S27AE